MNLFNKSMSKLASTNDSFINLIAEQANVRDDVSYLKSLLYTQTDLATLNAKITNLETLLRLYSTNQLIASPTINVTTIPGNPPSILLDSVASNYERIYVYRASEMYNSQGIIPITLTVPTNRDFLVNFTNDDEVQLDLPNNDKLTFVLDKDLYYLQSVDIVIDGGEFSTQNKMLDIYMNSDVSSTTSTNTQVLLAGGIDLPVFYNQSTQQSNSCFLWKDFKFNIDYSKSNFIQMNVSSRLEVMLVENQTLISNSIKPGDTLYLNNLFVGTFSIYDFSGQYTVQSVPTSPEKTLILDISTNQSFVEYGASASFPYNISGQLSNTPYFSLNKGKKIKITRVSNSTVLKERYTINVEDIK
jgi:hypothetical protein